MFWDKIAVFYDLFERAYNNKVINGTASICASFMDREDEVLECACGTGLITAGTAPLTSRYVATDFSEKMLNKCRRKMKGHSNTMIEFADITALSYADDSFDKVIAGNVIHLLDDPKKALDELRRVVKPGGMILIPTYLTKTDGAHRGLVGVFNRMGANFKKMFDMDSYRAFFEDMGYKDIEYRTAEGKMPCCIAIIRV
ncbi:Ubiquinone/menaquinone biosynthesis C-methylase UbiE [Ruminococcaceae bacterium KH2T8]|nr:Ubiquinone/menaquinone biosynthesis C-methylase UbiE [Ruminococcaceae bacterium KH2T8]